MPAPYSTVPGDTPGAAPGTSTDRAGDITLSGNLVLNGGVIELGTVSGTPLPLPNIFQLYTNDGVNMKTVGAGGQATSLTTGGQTINGVLAVTSAQGTSGVVQITNTVDNASDGTLHMEQFDPTSRAIGIRTTGDAQQMWVMLTNGTMAWGPGGAGARDTFLARTAAGILSVTTGSFSVTTAGQGLAVKEGSNAKQGTATLTAGSAVVANTSVTATSRIFLTSQADGGTPGFLRVSTRTAGTSFTITSSSGTDTSTVAYEIFEQG